MTTTVDGAEAVIDGTMPLPEIKPVGYTTEALLIKLAERTRAVTRAKSEHGVTGGRVKEANENREAIVAALAQRGIDLEEPTLDLRDDEEVPE